MPDPERSIDAGPVKRRKASADTRRKIADWDLWDCSSPEIRQDYDRPLSLFLHAGAAELSFASRGRMDLEPGDLLIIEAATWAIWQVKAPIRASYLYHDRSASASRRKAFIYGQEGKAQDMGSQKLSTPTNPGSE